LSVRVIMAAIAIMGSSAGAAQVQQSMNEITEKHDADVRARNAATDFFAVSTVSEGLRQVRFYVDRNTIKEVDSSGNGRAWVDVHEVIDAKRPIRLRHSKFLEEVRCGGEPQMRIKMLVEYAADGKARTESGTEPFRDVVPGSSQETVHRFICPPEPANAFYPVFDGNTPEKDAMSYFLRQPQ